MIKISALNEESSEESDEEDVPTITREAQEQIALTEYNKALELLKQNKQEDALNIFKDLLETELLDEVVKPEIPDGRSRPMLSLKYSCLKNIGAIQARWENYEAAIESYWKAGNLDDSDVTLWYRIGILAMEISNLELASLSFKKGLKCNSNHWPCLDSIITVLYAVPDYMNCLLYISIALERDPNYVKGLAFRDKIYKDIPCLEECYKLYNTDWQLDPPLYTEYDHIVGDKLLAEATEVAKKWSNVCKTEFNLKPLPELSLNKSIAKCVWLNLGESLLDMHKYITEKNLNFVSKIKLTVLKTDDKVVKITDEIDVLENNDKEIEPVTVPDTSAKEIQDAEKNVKSESESLQNEQYDVLNDNQEFGNALDTAMEIEIDDDKKSGSTDVQIIEDEDPLRILDADMLQFDENAQLKSSEFDENCKNPDEIFNNENRMLNEKLSDKESDKSNDKVYEKILEKDGELKGDSKSNDKGDGKEERQKVKKRRRSALCLLQQWHWSVSSMRRSARVRSSNRREAERDDVQLEETLRRIFPSNLLPDTVKLTKDDPTKGVDDSMDTMDMYQLFANQENGNNVVEPCKSSDSSKSPSPDIHQQYNYFGTDMEQNDVTEFINEYSGKSNLMIILAKYTEFLCTKWNEEWPEGLVEVYLQAYLFTREHIPHLPPFDMDVEDGILKLDADMTLLFGELHTDRWLDNKPDIQPSTSLDKLVTGLPSEELGHIIFTSIRGDLLNKENICLLVRVLWLKANIFLCQSDTDVVIESLELLLNRLQEWESQGSSICIQLPNCKCNSQISIKVVEKRLKSIQRGQKLGAIKTLYDEKKYVDLANVLKDTFKFARRSNKFLIRNEHSVDRVQQLAMLLESLWQLQQYEECYIWAEACLNESWQNYLNASDEEQQKKWTASILTALEKLEVCTIEVSTFVVKYLPETRLSRMVQNLVHIVCHQLDVQENAVEMPLETVLPWILLHYVLQYEEDKERAKVDFKSKIPGSHNSEAEDEDDGIPPSIMILFIAHEFIGRHSWCCFNEGKLLFFTINLIVPKLDTPQFSAIKDKLAKYLEQIFYCLYGHPNRVNKRPKLDDHVVPQMELTWEGAQLLFDFYKPKQLPVIESPKPSISAETEALFKRIIKLVPQDSNPNQIVEEMTAYILGERDKMPTITKPLPHSIASIYYLLGDFHFKNKKWLYAARYYLLDLCLHPSGLNSWAGLALATGSIIEFWLNSYKTISEDKFLSKAKIAQSSYQHAVELAPDHLVILAEYGNFVYMVHSFCSRLLKQETDTLSMERFDVLETRKEEMLEIADQCFQSAYRIQVCQGIDEMSTIHDERWLYQYMLGKIAEKRNQDPPIFLEYYSRASELLYENNAVYPVRISHKSPQNLSIEALEVHYRIHASILKYFEHHEGKPLKKQLGQLFQWHLKNCSQGPFMKYQSKLHDKKKEDISDADSTLVSKEAETSEVVGATVCQRSSSIEEIEIIDRISRKVEMSRNADQTKVESRKRPLDDVSQDNPKRIKLGSISHLQLMQDVVALIDDLITKVCEMVEQKERTCEDVVMLYSDESNEPKLQRQRNEESNCSFKSTAVQKVESTGSADAQQKNVSDEKSGTDEEKQENVQDLMDALMKQAMEISQEAEQSLDDEDTRKSDGKWLQNEDLQSTDKEVTGKLGEKKKVNNGIKKEEVTLSRRGSQESTTTTHTTTTTETNNSSSSSSDESSSSEDSSDSDSSTDSSSESAESETDKKKKDFHTSDNKEEYMTEEEVATLIAYCLAGLEQCVLRFSEHYKSLYRLSHFFFNNKTAKDIVKCRDLLLGTYKCQFYPGQEFQGLFADRKPSNFFNGVWHIPNRDIDRPGSFASHMSRCVTLLMQVLKETNDSRMLMQLCIQLGKIPEPDKKYLCDSEREQLSRQALTLCLQSLRSRVQTLESAVGSENLVRSDAHTHVLLDVYKMYQQVQKNFQGKESTVSAFAVLLSDAYKAYTGNKDVEGNVLEIAVKSCQRQIVANKISISNNVGSTAAPTQVTPSSPVTTPQIQITSTSPQTSQSRKPNKPFTSTGRPRGRPPNVNKYLQAMQQASNTFNQFNAKTGFAGYMGASGNRPVMSPYYMSPLVDPGTLALLSNLSSNMMDPLTALSYLNQVGSYQDMLRTYQNNLSSLTNPSSSLNNTTAGTSNVSNVPTMSNPDSVISTAAGMGNLNNLNNLTVQQLLNMSSSQASAPRPAPTYNQTTAKTTTASITKDRPSISITPVSASLPLKTKTSKPAASSDTSLPIHIPKSLQISQASKPVIHPPASQVSLLKPSLMQQTKPVTPKQMGAPQIRVSKSLTEPQPAHNSSLPQSPLKSSGAMNPVPQAPHPTIGSSLNIKPMMPMNVSAAYSGTSLQHKLLSKKNSQRAYPHAPSSRKQKALKTMPGLPSGLPSLLSSITGGPAMSQAPPYMPPELSGISVSPVPSGMKAPSMKLPAYKKSSVKSKPPPPPPPPTTTDIPSSLPASLSQAKSAETLSMLSQLQQHSHLEIIPQQKNTIKPSIDYGKSLSSGMSVHPQKVPDPSRVPTSSDCMSIYDVPRAKSASASNKKSEKHGNDSVEIITLDD